MAKKSNDAARKQTRVEESKIAMSYRLSPAKIARAQRILGTATATATIEEALDLVVFRRELTEGLDQAHGLKIVAAFPDAAPTLRSKRRR